MNTLHLTFEPPSCFHLLNMSNLVMEVDMMGTLMQLYLDPDSRCVHAVILTE